MTNQTEIDIFNDRYEYIGMMDGKAAHVEGQWHRTFSALAVNPDTRRVTLQKKTPDRYVFDRPDYADITVGGHYHVGETIEQGIREVHEELGLPIDYADLHPIGMRQTAVTLAPDYIEREFQHWHLLPLGLDLDQIPLDDAELSGLVDLNLDDAIALADGTTDQVTARYATRTETGMTYSVGTLTRDDLVPNYLKGDQLYLRLFVTARRYSAGERCHLFW